MEHAALKYARRVLAGHLLALAIVIGVVLAAARGIYTNTRAHAEAQARNRQELLAAQIARGIENHYAGILDQLDLLGQTDSSPLPRTPENSPSTVKTMDLAPILWRQLEGRASHLLVIDRIGEKSLELAANYSSTEAIAAQQIIAEMEAWLRQVAAPSISPFAIIGGLGMNLLAAPAQDEQGRVIVAAVPIRRIEASFLTDVNLSEAMSATLIDETSTSMATANRDLVGLRITQHMEDPRLRELFARLSSTGDKRQTVIADEPLELAGARLPPRMITVEPIKVPGGRTWHLLIASHLSEVEAVVSNVFRQAMWWSIFVVISMTAILVSTAVQMIRGRVRLERIKSDILHRELSQAREIQLHWLPDRNPSLRSIDIAAVNEPASHISGDFYNWFELDDGRTVVTIGDVTGHGMSAAFLMATTQLLVRTTMPRVLDPGRCLEEVNRQLCYQVFNGQFVTMLIMVLDVERGVVEIATAGHPPPLVGDGESFAPMRVEPQLLMGVDAEARYPTERRTLSPTCSLVLYTDGVPDAKSPDDRRFDVEGMQRCLYGRFDSAQLILDMITDGIDEFRGPRDLGDDVTLVAIQVQSAAGAAAGGGAVEAFH